MTYLTATNQELNIIDQKDTVNLVVKVTIWVGVAVVLLLSVDSISGERERGTLESLLLTPLGPRQIVAGKGLAALTVWPIILLAALPYVGVLRPDSGLFADALGAAIVVGSLLTVTFASLGVTVSALGAAIVVGSLLTVTFASLGVTVSALTNSNRQSLLLSFFIFLALVLPTQLPGGALKGWLGDIVNRANPLNAGSQFVDKVVVSNNAWASEAEWLISPFVAASAALLAATLVCGRLRLQGGLSK